MSDENPNPEPPSEPKARPVGSTEHSWCRAVPTGTGITVLAFLFSKPPDLSNLQNALHIFQNAHPILLSKLHHTPTTAAAAPTFSFITPTTPHLQITTVDLSSTSLLLQTLSPNNISTITPFHTLLEHELNKSSWLNPDHPSYTDADVMFATVYALEDEKWVVALRLHTAACDRTSAVTLLREMMVLIGDGGGTETGSKDKGEVSLGIESYVPSGKSNKPFWARGVDVLGYSLNSLRLSNLNFKDAGAPRSSQVVRLQMSSHDTDHILYGCKSRGIKLCGVLAAAALIAARSSKGLPEQQWEKYAVVTLVDCRSALDPPLSSHDFAASITKTSSSTHSDGSIDPYLIPHSENPTAVLVAPLLSGDNYGTWIRAITMALRAKNKLGFVDGSITKPDDAPTLGCWERCNDLVGSWLLNSVNPDIRTSILYADTARDIWLDLHERFSQTNAPRIYQLKQSISVLKQDGQSVSVYFTRLKSLWDELNSLGTIQPCICGHGKATMEHLQQDRAMEFLQGLHDHFSAIRSQILLMHPFPSTTKIYSLVRQEEKQQEINSAAVPFVDSAALQAHQPNKRPRPHCDHCGRVGHLRATCYKLHGFPKKDTKFPPANNALAVPPVAPAPFLSHEQYAKLLALLAPGASPSSDSAGPVDEETDWSG